MPQGTPTSDDNVFDYSGMWTDAMWEVDLQSLTVDIDPFIDALVSVKNPSGATQTYTFMVVLPVPALAGPTVHGGSTAATLLDADFSGSATMGQSGATPMYMGMIDGAGVLGMLPPDAIDVPLTVGIAGGVDVASKVLGLPGPTLPSGAVNTSIAIQHKFTLTAGDNATFNSFFVVVPEPTTLSVLLLAGVFLLRHRSSSRK